MSYQEEFMKNLAPKNGKGARNLKGMGKSTDTTDIVVRVFDTAGTSSNVGMTLNLPTGWTQTGFRALDIIEEEVTAKYPTPTISSDGKVSTVHVDAWGIETVCFTVSSNADQKIYYEDL